MTCICIIPARYASTRFPGKPLALLAGKPIIQHVYEHAAQCVHHTYVATDNRLIYDAVTQFGGHAIMTSTQHQSGTERLMEALGKIDAMDIPWDVAVNLQGDEPFVGPNHIHALCRCFETDASVEIATLVARIKTQSDLDNINVPKVIINRQHEAVYFSRSTIPYIRNVQKEEWLAHYPFMKHIGLYAFSKNALQKISTLALSPLEEMEKLEQLRWIENGLKIKTAVVEDATIGIDTPEDLRKAEAYIKAKLTK